MWDIFDTIGTCIAGGLVCFTAAYFGGRVALDKYLDELYQAEETEEVSVGFENMASNLRQGEKR